MPHLESYHSLRNAQNNRLSERRNFMSWIDFSEVFASDPHSNDETADSTSPSSSIEGERMDEVHQLDYDTDECSLRPHRIRQRSEETVSSMAVIVPDLSYQKNPHTKTRNHELSPSLALKWMTGKSIERGEENQESSEVSYLRHQTTSSTLKPRTSRAKSGSGSGTLLL